MTVGRSFVCKALPRDTAVGEVVTMLTGYHRTEAEYPELRSLVTFSAAWYRRWRDLHLLRYPDSDFATRANLDMFVDMAEQREATS